MFGSTRISYLILRLGLAFVFLWFGIDKFIHPNYWINAWLPPWFIDILSRFGLDSLKFIYLNGIFEVVIGLGFVFNVYIRLFSFLASLFLILVIFGIGLNEIVIRDVGLLAGALALFFWREGRKYGNR